MEALNAQYWNQRYLLHDTPWDLGSVSPPLKHFFDQLTDKNLRVLIPGAGHAYEAGYLHDAGFPFVYVCDWAHEALREFSELHPAFPTERLLEEDFFQLQGHYDLIIEQTFFCALAPALRPAYAQQMHELLVPGGKLVGLLFAETFPFEGPPFGGTLEEYEGYFSPLFEIKQMEIAPDSIRPRAGRELFIVLEKPFAAPN